MIYIESGKNAPAWVFQLHQTLTNRPEHLFLILAPTLAVLILPQTDLEIKYLNGKFIVTLADTDPQTVDWAGLREIIDNLT